MDHYSPLNRPPWHGDSRGGSFASRIDPGFHHGPPPPRHHNDRRAPFPRGPSDYNNAADHYAPNNAPMRYFGDGSNGQHDFSFRSHPSQGAEPRFSNRQPPARGRGRSSRRGRFDSKPTERELLRAKRAPTPEQFEGMRQGEARFKEVGSVLTSDGDDEQHKSKRIRRSSADVTTPKWSNPDPYTALPPPSDLPAAGTNVLNLINHAKANESQAQRFKVDSEDFISFTFNDIVSNSGNSSLKAGHTARPPNVGAHNGSLNTGAGHANRPPPPPPTNEGQPPPPPPPTNKSQPPPPPPPTNKGQPPPPPPPTNKGQPPPPPVPRKRKYVSEDLGDVTVFWQADDESAIFTPWHTLANVANGDPRLWLHQEIVAFEKYVSPRDFEVAARCDLLARLRAAVSRSGYNYLGLETFGSFASDVYLPTADMDIVAMSLSGGAPFHVSYGTLRKFGDMLIKAGLVKTGSMLLVPKAKVPIVKFVEPLTGLRVDICFDNHTGFDAVEVIRYWSGNQPAMRPIVLLLKQFLIMRGLADNATGGLSGFSIVCLVYSAIHHMQMKNGSQWEARQHLDDVLLEVLTHYGTVFDRDTTGIDMRRLEYFPKASFQGRRSQAGRLLIVDPNRPDNDISGGSQHVGVIFDLFKKAANDLDTRLELLDITHQKSGPGSSVLAPVWAGNYATMTEQRERLKGLRLNIANPPTSLSQDYHDRSNTSMQANGSLAQAPQPSIQAPLAQAHGGPAQASQIKSSVKSEKKGRKAKVAHLSAKKKKKASAPVDQDRVAAGRISKDPPPITNAAKTRSQKKAEASANKSEPSVSSNKSQVQAQAPAKSPSVASVGQEPKENPHKATARADRLKAMYPQGEVPPRVNSRAFSKLKTKLAKKFKS